MATRWQGAKNMTNTRTPCAADGGAGRQADSRRPLAEPVQGFFRKVIVVRDRVTGAVLEVRKAPSAEDALTHGRWAGGGNRR